MTIASPSWPIVAAGAFGSEGEGNRLLPGDEADQFENGAHALIDEPGGDALRIVVLAQFRRRHDAFRLQIERHTGENAALRTPKDQMHISHDANRQTEDLHGRSAPKACD